MVRSSLDNLQDALGYRFRNPELLLEAFTHSSFARESSPGVRDNEQMEFLGDAVLNFLVSVRLADAFPEGPEGKLSRARAGLVSAAHFAQVAARLGLGRCLRLGRGEEKTDGRAKPALLANALEALVAALFRDGGLEAAEVFVDRYILPPDFREDAAGLFSVDFKSALQELLQSEHRPPAEYRVTEESGPEHEKLFTVEVTAAGGRAARGTGRSKKAAEQRAAELLLEQLGKNNHPHDTGL
jgi:ribonuclease III